MHLNEGIPLFVNYQGKPVRVGLLGHDGTFRKVVYVRQKLLKLDSYGIDEPIFRQLEKLGCERIELCEFDTNIIYSIDFNMFKKLAVPRAIGKFGLRYYLPLKYWHSTKYSSAGDELCEVALF